MKHYGLLGYPLGHTMSPPIHQKLFKLDGENADYTLQEISPEMLSENIDKLMSLDGFNITIPHKVNIIDYLDELDLSAQRYEAVNCVCVKNGRRIGYNTDCDGFLRSLEAAGAGLSGRVLQCGCGGVGRMTAIEAVRHGADLTVAVRRGSENKADCVLKYAQDYPNAKVRIAHEDEISGEFDVLVNATSVGMFPKTDACPIGEDIIKKCGFVFDVIYNPEKTKLIQIAESYGIKTCGGMGMLVWQAAVAHEIWNGAKYKVSDIDKIIAQMLMLMKGEV